MSNVQPNPSRVAEALRDVRRLIERAERGDAAAGAALIRASVADELESKLTRVAALADRCTPTLDEIKLNEKSFGADAVQLRFEIGHVENVLNRAAGRATVVELPASASPQKVIEREGGDASHDSGEFPRPLGAA